MTRITKDDRVTIRNAALAHRFQKETEVLVADYAAFANDVYETIYSKADRELMAKLPKGWLSSVNEIKVKFGESYCTLPFNGRINYVTVPDYLSFSPPTVYRVMAECHRAVCAEVFDADHPLAERHSALSNRASDLRTEVSSAAKLAGAILEQGTTVAKLLAIWPEAKPFVGFLMKPKASLPALPITTLNGLLDLPVEKAA